MALNLAGSAFHKLLKKESSPQQKSQTQRMINQ